MKWFVKACAGSAALALGAAVAPIAGAWAQAATSAASPRGQFHSRQVTMPVPALVNLRPAGRASSTRHLAASLSRYVSPAAVVAGRAAGAGSDGPRNEVATLGAGHAAEAAAAGIGLTAAPQPAIAVGVEGTDGQMWVQAPQLGAGWKAMAGQITAPPAVAAAPSPDGSAPAQPLFIAAGAGGDLYIRSLTVGWQEVGPVHGVCVGGPSAVITGSTLTVACRGTDNALWESTAAVPATGLPQFTSGWTSLGGPAGGLLSGPAVAPVGGTMTFFARGASNRIYTRTLAAGWQAAPWTCAAAPAAAVDAAGNDTIFACHGTDNALWESVNGGAGWTPAVSLGGSMIGQPAVAATSGGPEFLVEGTDNAVWERTPATGFTSLGGGASGGVGAAALSFSPAAPGAPTGVTASPGDGQAVVSWTPPASAGMSPVTSYTVTSVPGSITATAAGTATSATVTGLANGTAYRFYVTATSAAGTSPPSASSAPVTPSASSAPDAPFITNVTARDSAVAVTWSPPDSGTATLTGYVLTASTGGSAVSTVSEPPAATQATVTGLTNETDYTFTIAAVNGNGTGPSSPPSTPVAPRPAAAPLAPANPIAVAQNGEVEVIWDAPADGGSPVTGYTVALSPATVGPVQVSAGTTVVTVTGLTNGQPYMVSITADNNAGTSAAATAGPVTPAAAIAPTAPTNVIASATAAGAVALQWTPPMDPGTSVITAYEVSASTGGTVAQTLSVASSACTGTPVACQASMTGLTSTAAYTFTVVAQNAVGSGPASAATGAVTANVVASSSLVVLTSSSAATMRYVEADGTLVFEQPPSQVTGLQAGQTVYVPQTSVAPDGFIGKVTSVTTQGGFVLVATAPATLNDAFTAYYASTALPFDASLAQLINAAPGVSISRPTVGGHPAPGTVRPADSPVNLAIGSGSLTLNVETDLLQGDSEEGSEQTVTTGPQLHVEASLTLTPVLDASFSNGVLGFTIGGKVKADASIRAGVHLAADPKMYLGEIQGPTIDIQVGEIPVPSRVVFSAYLVASLDGSIGIEFSASYDHESAATCTIYTGSGGTDGCSQVDQTDGQSGGLDTGITPYAAMSLSAGVQLGVSLQIAFIAGPEITLTPELAISVDTTKDPWWELDFQGNLGVAVTAFQAWGEGKTLYENTDVVTIGPFDLADAGGPFAALEISPTQATAQVGDVDSFTATLINAAGSSNPAATWSVAAGPGTIDSQGNYTATQDGVAVVQAAYNGMTARATVVTGPAIEADNTSSGLGGLPVVDGAVADWAQLQLPAQPQEFAVTAQAQQPGAITPNEVVYASAAATHAYLPGLTPGIPYTLTVYAVGPGGGVVGTATDIVPLDPLPDMFAGTHAHGDVAVDASGKPDDTGTAGGSYGATVSGNGQYVFFFTQARSNLAPAAIYNPASSDIYLVRKSLLTGKIDVASIGLDGHTPVPATSIVLANTDGSAVAFTIPPDNASVVHNFTTGTTWQFGQGLSIIESLAGLSSSGTVVSFTTLNPGALGNVYRQVQGGMPVQVDACPTGDTATCYTDDGASMSADGNLIAYTGKGPYANGADYGDIIYMYNASTGSDTSAFTIPTCVGITGLVFTCLTETNPVISGDGSTLAVDVQGYVIGDPLTLQLDKLDNGSVTQNAIATVPYDFTNDVTPIAIDQDGGSVVYGLAIPDEPGFDMKIVAYANGATLLAPALSYTIEATAVITDDGSEVFYTLLDVSDPVSIISYPGVYGWKLEG